ncbi:MAG: TonB-dependent receptor plug domain-containing protein [Chitinophagaceae bacterium]
MKRKILFVAACITGSALFAQDSSKMLNEVIINVTKFPLKQSETGKVINIITQDQLQNSLGKTFSEVLNQQAGITISGANNTLGTNQSIYIRGASSANTLILLDGIPLYDASGISSEFDINNFSLNNIEKIEILKGSQSTLYGSDAVAGVINIITKKTSDKPVNLDINLSAGSYNTYKGFASISGSNDNGQTYFISYSNIHSKGFSSAYDSTGNKSFDKDGFDQNAFQVSYGFRPLKKLETKLYSKYNINKADIDAGAFADDKDYTYKYRNFITGIAASYKLLKSVLHLNYNYNWFERNFTDDSVSVGGFANYQKGNYAGKSHFAEVYSKWQLNKHFDLLAGIDYRRNATDQNYFYFPNYGFLSPALSSDSTKSSQVSGYASLFLKNFSGFSAELGGRWNHHNIYRNNFTYSFNPSYLKNNFKIFANISSGYRVPSLYQLYSEYGNKNLKPETSTSTEAGLQFITDKINVRAVLFNRNIKDVFVFYTDPVTFAGKYINDDRQKDHGVETDIILQLSDKLNISSNYTYVEGKIYTKNFIGKDTAYNNLYRRPSNTFNVTIGCQALKNLIVSSHFKTVSKFYEPQFAAAPYQLKGYYTIGFYGEYKLNKKFKIFADFQNITDQKYFDVRGFNSRRFNINAGINLNL